MLLPRRSGDILREGETSKETQEKGHPHDTFCEDDGRVANVIFETCRLTIKLPWGRC